MVTSDSYRVQTDSNMVKSDLHGWLETECGIKLTCMKVALIGGKRMSNWMYMMLTCQLYQYMGKCSYRVQIDFYMVKVTYMVD